MKGILKENGVGREIDMNVEIAGASLIVQFTMGEATAEVSFHDMIREYVEDHVGYGEDSALSSDHGFRMHKLYGLIENAQELIRLIVNTSTTITMPSAETRQKITPLHIVPQGDPPQAG